MKRLLLVTPSLSGGGAEKVAVNLANYFHSKSTFSITLLAFSDKGNYHNKLLSDLRYCTFQARRLRNCFFEFCKYLIVNDYDYVVSVMRNTNVITGLAYYLRPNVRLVFREANTFTEFSKCTKLKKLFFKFIFRLAYYRANLIIANSCGTKKSLLSFKIVDKRKVHVINNPVIPHDVQTLKTEKISDNWLRDKNIRVVLNVGRLHDQKNQALLLEAFAIVREKMSNVRLIIIGQGDLLDDLISKSIQLGIKQSVKFLKFQDNIFPYFQSADVFALSSQWEGFGNVLVEALACGCPVVSTNCPGGPRSILNNGEYGKLVPNKDPISLADGIMHVLSNSKFSSVEYKNKLINRSLDYSIENISKQYQKLIES